MTCTSICPELFDYVVAIGPPFVTSVIATFVAFVAYQQWKTNQNKLRLDLYNRRFEVYSNTITFFQELSALPPGDRSEEFKEVQRAFIRSCRESQFLFSDESKIFEMLEKIHSDSFKVIGLKASGSSLAGDPELLSKMALDASAALADFDASIKKIETAMSKYLRFHGDAT
ncbi:hypothetical protein EGI20_04030 [Aquitalea sp. S1-19]|nr:hypothetical protein [Aquitalea sp. S1-19]